VKSASQRQNERRKEKLQEVRRQIDEGSLVVRRMTLKEERAAARAARAAQDRRRKKS
jgi:hypothetical protein